MALEADPTHSLGSQDRKLCALVMALGQPGACRRSAKLTLPLFGVPDWLCALSNGGLSSISDLNGGKNKSSLVASTGQRSPDPSLLSA